MSEKHEPISEALGYGDFAEAAATIPEIPIIGHTCESIHGGPDEACGLEVFQECKTCGTRLCSGCWGWHFSCDRSVRLGRLKRQSSEEGDRWFLRGIPLSDNAAIEILTSNGWVAGHLSCGVESCSFVLSLNLDMRGGTSTHAATVELPREAVLRWPR